MRGHGSTRYHTARAGAFLLGLEDSTGGYIKRTSHNHALECQTKYSRELSGSAKQRTQSPDFAQRRVQGLIHHEAPRLKFGI